MVAFDFPASPPPGTTYNPTGGPGFVYDGTRWIGSGKLPPNPITNSGDAQPGRYFGADGTQAGDVTAITLMMADAVAKGYTPSYLHDPIIMSSLYTHPDTESFLPVLKAFWDSPAAEGHHFIFDLKRKWNAGTVRPSGAQLGPQSQYITPPRCCTIEWEKGAFWDFRGFPITQFQPSICRRQARFGTPLLITNDLVKGVTETITVANTAGIAKYDRLQIRATAQINTLVGAFTLVDNQMYSYWATATAYKLADVVRENNGTPDYMCIVAHTATTFAADLAAGKWALYTYNVPAFWAPAISYGLGIMVLSQSKGATYKCLIAHTSTTFDADLAAGKWLPVAQAARCEPVIVESTTATTVRLPNAVIDNYPIACQPVLVPVLDEPRIRLINPCAEGCGWNNNPADPGGDVLFWFVLGRDFEMDGGVINNFGTSPLKIAGMVGGHVRDTQFATSARDTGTGSSLYIADEMTDFVFDNVTVRGQGQLFMLSGTGRWELGYGISRRVLFLNCHTYGGGGFSTHNMHEEIEWRGCTHVNGDQPSIDVRCPNSRVIDCDFRNIKSGGGIHARMSPNGLLVDNVTVDGALQGFYLTNYTGQSEEYDYPPGDITIQNCNFKNIGGVGGAGGINCNFNDLMGGAIPTLGRLIITNNHIHMKDSVSDRGIEIGGKWTNPLIARNHITGGNPAAPGRGIYVWDGGHGTGNGAINPTVIDNTFTTGFSYPLISNWDLSKHITVERNTQIDATTLMALDSTANVTLTSGWPTYLMGGAGPLNHIYYAPGMTGREVTFIFTTAQTVNHNGSVAGNQSKIMLAGGVNRNVQPGNTLTLISDGTVWREKLPGNIIRFSFVHDFPSINANSFQYVQKTVPGAEFGDRVEVSANLAAASAGVIFKGQVVAANEVMVHAVNFTAGAIDPASATFYLDIIKHW